MLHEKLAWAFLGLCTGLVSPAVALMMFLAIGLSDWASLEPIVARGIAFAVPAAIILGLSWSAHRYSRAAVFVAPACGVGIAIALKAGLLLPSSTSYI